MRLALLTAMLLAVDVCALNSRQALNKMIANRQLVLFMVIKRMVDTVVYYNSINFFNIHYVFIRLLYK